MATKVPAHIQSGQAGDEHRAGRQQERCELSGSELLELLGDEYTRRVLQAVVDEPKSGREVVEDASVSKATAYRRLDTLRDAGLVTASTVLDPKGHHHEQFLATVESITLDVDDGDLSANVHYR